LRHADGLDRERANAWAALALANVTTEYPNKLDHLLTGATDIAAPRALHPVFYGSYDWHSAVHMHWLLARLARLVPDLAPRAAVDAHFESHFTAAAIAAECAYLERAASATFERTYGWSWLLKLFAELSWWAESDRAAQPWAERLAPLAERFVQRYLDYLPRAAYPVRAGTHANSAFGLLFALEYARRADHPVLARLVEDKARDWFAGDQHYPAAYEPGNSDFLSPGLMEAVLQQAVLRPDAFSAWWERFEPAAADLAHWLSPVAVSDRSDPQTVHLDGLNLSRAWCWSRLAPGLPERLRGPAATAYSAHLAASLDEAISGHYVGTHWLASFALLALTG
jgi:hypothetical protein